MFSCFFFKNVIYFKKAAKTHQINECNKTKTSVVLLKTTTLLNSL